jgi:hypothetical protein
LNLALKVEPLWAGLLASSKLLSRHAVKSRYPGSWLGKAEAKDMFARCREIRDLVRQSLGLK